MRIRYLAVAIALTATFAQADDKKVATFNTESDADTHWFKVAETIRAAGKVDVWALQEVESYETIARYTEAAASWGRNNYRYIVSESGAIPSQHRSNDFLAIVYNSNELRQIEMVELHSIRSKPSEKRLGDPNWKLRGALFIRLYDEDTGTEFYVGNVHLKCCDEGKNIRAHQVNLLLEWISRADVPVILAGDFNIAVATDNKNLDSLPDAF